MATTYPERIAEAQNIMSRGYGITAFAVAEADFILVKDPSWTWPATIAINSPPWVAYAGGQATLAYP